MDSLPRKPWSRARSMPRALWDCRTRAVSNPVYRRTSSSSKNPTGAAWSTYWEPIRCARSGLADRRLPHETIVAKERCDAMSLLVRPELLYVNGTFVPGRAVRVSDGGAVEAIVASDAASDNTIDLPGKALLPGFVNIHSHSFQ